MSESINLENIANLQKDIALNSLSINQVNKILSPEELNTVCRSLNDGANLEINLQELKEDEIKSLISNLKLTGFQSVNYTEESNKIKCVKKVWKKGVKSDNPWKALKTEEKVELVLEDELIDPFDNYQKFSKASDCITKPKPCKNCNCGRADKENEAQKVAKDFKPECGKCYMGDAYRCAGCPYRGQPAFEPGDKVQFKNVGINAGNDLEIEEESTVFNLKNDKVKIDI